MTKTRMMQLSILMTVGTILLTWPMTSADAFVTSGAVADVSGLTYNYGAGGSSATAGGVFVKLLPPIGSVGNDNHQSHNLFAFDEGQNLASGGPVTVDLLPGGGSGVIPDGTYASHYVFYDPASTSTIEGCVDFDSDIVGVITSRPNLIASDGFQDTATTGAVYLSPSLRGLESNQDDVAIVDADTICLAFKASSPGDYIRVLTNFSPLGEDTDDDGILDGNDNCPDGDGLCADVDNCPDNSNADQSDVDQDGIGDVCDNVAPICADSDGGILWPPNHKMKSIDVTLDATDEDGDNLFFTILSVFQDEPVDAKGDGKTSPDATIIDDDTVELRAERSGNENGRVYHITVEASDGELSCTGTITVGVPHDKKDTPIDDGPLYDSTTS